MSYTDPYASLINPEKWYKVGELSIVLGWSEDAIYDWIARKQLRAFVPPARPNKPKRGKGSRIYRAVKILGAEAIRFIKENLTK